MASDANDLNSIQRRRWGDGTKVYTRRNRRTQKKDSNNDVSPAPAAVETALLVAAPETNLFHERSKDNGNNHVSQPILQTLEAEKVKPTEQPEERRIQHQQDEAAPQRQDLLTGNFTLGDGHDGVELRQGSCGGAVVANGEGGVSGDDAMQEVNGEMVPEGNSRSLSNHGEEPPRENHEVSNGFVKPVISRVEDRVGAVGHIQPRPFRPPSLTVVENNNVVGEFVGGRRGPQGESVLQELEFLLGKDRLPSESSKIEDQRKWEETQRCIKMGLPLIIIENNCLEVGIIEAIIIRVEVSNVSHDAGLPTPTSRKALIILPFVHGPVPYPYTYTITSQARTLERSESITGAADPRKKPSNFSHVGRTPVPKKPKAKDPNKRDMTYEEKQKLSTNLENLPPRKAVQLFRSLRRAQHLIRIAGRLEVDIDSVDAETLWELDRFVTNYKKSLSKTKRKAELALQARARAAQSVPIKSLGPIVADTALKKVELKVGDRRAMQAVPAAQAVLAVIQGHPLVILIVTVPLHVDRMQDIDLGCERIFDFCRLC
ncbi:hypothetical protein HAX54_006991 [Datura stramonium]|uniref:NET domain-containing protein n=1 Tax=Datura stramonium TaxID=4076 RepID=A0ABS8TB55_DATST|nr:hypothetical protein [Datura stramonium]